MTWRHHVSYSGRTPQHYCAVPYGTHVNESIPIDENTGDLHKCKMYAENSTNVTTSCDYGWDYINVDGDYTIVNEVIIATATWIYNTYPLYPCEFLFSWRNSYDIFKRILSAKYFYAYILRWIPATHLEYSDVSICIRHWLQHINIDLVS